MRSDLSAIRPPGASKASAAGVLERARSPSVGQTRPRPPRRGPWPVEHVELGGIEPPSAEGSPSPIRPFPCSRLAAAGLPGQLPRRASAWAFPGVRGLSLPSAVSPAVHHCFCCRAAVVWPRVASRLAVFLTSPEDQAARAKSALDSALLWVPRFSSLSNSGRTNDFPSRRRNHISPVVGDERLPPRRAAHISSPVKHPPRWGSPILTLPPRPLFPPPPSRRRPVAKGPAAPSSINGVRAAKGTSWANSSASTHRTGTAGGRSARTRRTKALLPAPAAPSTQ